MPTMERRIVMRFSTTSKIGVGKAPDGKQARLTGAFRLATRG
ncbi:MAG TPA: hypothetical protein VD833_09515 [Vicinamibacterales bacterium]|nr:hypothetical protein [Vicinamibacterales bacterium]